MVYGIKSKPKKEKKFEQDLNVKSKYENQGAFTEKAKKDSESKNLTTHKERVGVSSSHYRPYVLSDGKEVNKIHVVENGKVVFSSKSGWLEDKGKGDVKEIFLSSQPKRKLKVNLAEKDSFYVKSPKQDYAFEKNRVDLYLTQKDAKLLEVKPNNFQFATATRENYQDYYKLKVGDKVITESSYFNSKDTEFGKEVNKVYSNLKDDDISQYQVEKVMKKYRLVKRQKPIRS